MECKLTITGSFADIQQALALLQGGNPMEAMVQTITPENYRHDPPADFPLKAIDLKRKETMANGATLNPDLPVEPMERIEHPAANPPKRTYRKKAHPKPKPAPAQPSAKVALAERLCHTCGKTFVPTRITMHHCSKQCYMIEWRERNKQPKAVAAANEGEKDTSTLGRKLEEYRKTCPAPRPRPYSQRDISI